MRDEQRDVDAESLIEFFSMEKEKNSSFVFDYELDASNKLIRYFWADHYARRSYEFFGDVEVFDTTYNINKYDLIFAPLTGVNHHCEPIFFGCALLSDEKIKFFVWLFNKFLNVMSKGTPQVIITNQDPAMTKAISEILPQIVHCYCIWHILNKFSNKLGVLNYCDNYKFFKSVILNFETREELEISWPDLLQRTKLQNNAWLCQLYDIRRNGFLHMLINILVLGCQAVKELKVHIFS